MKSSPPDEAAASGDLQVVVSGASIEMRALLARLAARGAQVSALPLPEGVHLTPHLVLCDLAAEGALAAATSFYANHPGEPSPHFVTLGNASSALSDAENELLSRARQRFRRPLDVQNVTETLLVLLREPRVDSRMPQSHAELSLPSLKPRSSSQQPRGSASPSRLPSTAPSEPPSSLPALDPVPPPQSRAGGPNPEHSVVSPELETLLVEAERRVHAQISRGTEAPAPGHEGSPDARLAEDVWAALAEPLDDEMDHPLGEGSFDEAAAHSPLALGADAELELPVAVATTPPPEPWDEALEEPTGAHATGPDSEQTSGGDAHPITAAADADAPATLGPRRARRNPSLPARSAGGSDDEPSESGTDAPDEVAESEGPATQTPGPPSTLPPGARERSASTRPPRYAPAERLQEPLPPLRAPYVPELEEERLEPRSPPSEMPEQLELPGALVRGAAALVMGRAVRQRFSGCLAFEVDKGLRRVVLKDGDLMIAASAVHGESLVSFLAQRGDLAPDMLAQLEHRIPPFGRHAGAALIARGLLEQGELWPVLRAHSEWVLTQALAIERGSVQIEYPLAERLAAEPSVFGAATGAEVLVEVVQRTLSPEQALSYLGSAASRMAPGGSSALLSECGLSRELTTLVERSRQMSLAELLREAHDQPMLPCVLYALSLLDVLAVREPDRASGAARELREATAPDTLDDDAVRARVSARRALVDDGDYFALLGVPRQATGYDIRRSYVALRRQFDPGQVLRPSTLDLEHDVDTILEVLDEAYEILRDQQRRERYRRAIESLP